MRGIISKSAARAQQAGTEPRAESEIDSAKRSRRDAGRQYLRQFASFGRITGDGELAVAAGYYSAVLGCKRILRRLNKGRKAFCRKPWRQKFHRGLVQQPVSFPASPELNFRVRLRFFVFTLFVRALGLV
jgi:hypothetical protein